MGPRTQPRQAPPPGYQPSFCSRSWRQCGWSHLGRCYCASSRANHKLCLHLNLLWQMSHELSKVSCVLLASASPISASDFAAPASFASTAAIASNVQISPNLEKKDLRCHKTYSIPLHLPYVHQVSPGSASFASTSSIAAEMNAGTRLVEVVSERSK